MTRVLALRAPYNVSQELSSESKGSRKSREAIKSEDVNEGRAASKSRRARSRCRCDFEVTAEIKDGISIEEGEWKDVCLEDVWGC